MINRFFSAIKIFLNDESGVTAIEYALIAALIGTGIVAGATFLGNKLNNFFTEIGNVLKLS